MFMKPLAITMITTAFVLASCQSSKPSESTPLAITNDDRFNSDEVQANEWSFLGIKGEQIRTRHWDLRTTMRSERFRQILPTFYEKALDRYQNAFGVELPPPGRSLEDLSVR